jgi:hypothetical protein
VAATWTLVDGIEKGVEDDDEEEEEEVDITDAQKCHQWRRGIALFLHQRSSKRRQCRVLRWRS